MNKNIISKKDIVIPKEKTLMKTILNIQKNPNIEKMQEYRCGVWLNEPSKTQKKIYRKLRKANEKETTMKLINNQFPQ
jgi:S-ribosylhomocysteine lyase LuxS involved in autoinducer biosynthesis